MTVFTKAVFSLVLLAAGFGLASLFGPPELADGLANALRPDTHQPNWGALQPLDDAALQAPAWQEYEAAAFRSPSRPGLNAEPSQLAGKTGQPSVEPSTYGGPAPLWSPDGAAPIASWRVEKPIATDVLVSPAPRQDYGVSTAAWREPTAPVGWPLRQEETADASQAPSLMPRQNLPAAEPAGPTRLPPIGRPAAAPANPAFQPTTPAPAANDWAPWGAAPPRPQPDPPSFGPPAALVAVGGAPTPTVETRAPAPIRHIVSDGDTLARIAQRYLKDPQRAGEVFLANQSTLTNPDLLPIGVELVIPSRHAAGNVSANGAAPYAAADDAPRARLLSPQASPPASLAQW